MRKIKPRVGATVAWRADAFPFTFCMKISKVEAGRPFVHQGGQDIAIGEPLFCVSEADHDELAKAIVDLRLKHDQAVAIMQTNLNNRRRRSVLGQLDPRT